MQKVKKVNKRFKQTTKQKIIEKLKQSEHEIKNGEGIDADVAFKQLRQKYEYQI